MFALLNRYFNCTNELPLDQLIYTKNTNATSSESDIVSDVSVNSSLNGEDNSIVNSPLTISTKSESSPYNSLPPPQYYPSSLYESFPYLYFATPYANIAMDDIAFPAAKRMRYDSSSFVYPPIPVEKSSMNHLPSSSSYYPSYTYPIIPSDSSTPSSTIPSTTPSAPVSPTPTEDSLDSSLSESVEDEAEVWKDVLTFYCGEISTTEAIDGTSIILIDELLDEPSPDSTLSVTNSYSI